jgi:hypothetical protein
MAAAIQTFIAYASDAWAVERTLRLFQASFWLLSLTGPATYIPQAAHAKAKIHLARRFFRCFKWVESWVAVFTSSSDVGSLHENLMMLRDATLGLYYFLDMLVVPTAVGAVEERTMQGWMEGAIGVKGGVSWLERTVSVTWFYAIALTLVLLVLELTSAPSTPEPTSSEKGKKNGSGKEVAKAEPKTKSAMKRMSTPALATALFNNSLDLLIPGSAVGYVKFDSVYVAIGMITSSLITMQGIWRRIYAEKSRST